jgi:hypothetical protein
MVQTLIVSLIVVAAVGYLGWQVYRFFVPRVVAGRACGGSCCSHREPETPKVAAGAGAARGGRMQMITSDSLRARIKARQG